MYLGGDLGNMVNIGMFGFIDLVGMCMVGKCGGMKCDIDDVFFLLIGIVLCVENDIVW